MYVEQKQNEKKLCAESRLKNNMNVLLNASILPDKFIPYENLKSRMPVLHLFRAYHLSLISMEDTDPLFSMNT